MIAPGLVNQLKTLKRQDKLAAIRLLEDELAAESTDHVGDLTLAEQSATVIGPILATDDIIKEFEAMISATNSSG